MNRVVTFCVEAAASIVATELIAPKRGAGTVTSADSFTTPTSMTQDPLDCEHFIGAREVQAIALRVRQDLPAQGAAWRVCVRSADGTASAALTFHSYEQVLLFEQRVQGLGYEMLMLDERFRHCDFAPINSARAAIVVY